MLFGRRYKFPLEIMKIEHALVHITDTPNSTFGFIKALLRVVEPDVIVHTGDLVDNYKLERSARNLIFYVRDIKKINDIFSKVEPKEILITLGNHDDEGSVRTCIPGAEVEKKFICWSYGEKTFAMSHYYTFIKEMDVDYKLFGHSLEAVTDMSQGVYNGIQHAHVIDLDTGKVHFIPYPKGTDHDRIRLFKGGL